MLHRLFRRWLRRESFNPPKQQRRYRPSFDSLEDRLAPAGFFVAGADAGGGPNVHVFDAQTGEIRAGFFAFDPGFTGGVRVATGDLTGDGVPDIVAAAGPGGGPQVKVFDGRNLTFVASFFAFDAAFTGGVNIAVGDVNNDGVVDIIAAAGKGGGPNVRVFDIANGQAAQIAGPLGNFMAFDPGFLGGVNVAAGNVDGTPGDEIITGAGPGGGPQVQVFAASGAVQASFFAFDAHFTGGVFVAAGDVNDDLHGDIIVAAGAGGGPQVKVFSGVDGALLDSFFAYDSAFTGGVRVAAVDANGDAHSDIITAPGPGGGPNVRVFDSQAHNATANLFAFDAAFTGGVYTAGEETFNQLSSWQVTGDALPISRLARFVPNSSVPSVGNWVQVNPGDSNLKGNVYVIVHGFAPYFLSMVQANGTPSNPLKWWQTLNTALTGSPGFPNTAALFYGTTGGSVIITPTGLANAIALADPKAVVLAYSWVDQSATNSLIDVYKSEAYTSLNGATLAAALETALPAGFHNAGGTLHMIGHSHGSKVATVATIALDRTGSADYQVSHLSILDSPEDNSIGGSLASQVVYSGDASNNLWFYLGELNSLGFPNPTFVDNFASYFDNPFGPIRGVNPFNPSVTSPTLQQVADVILAPQVVYDITAAGDKHSYAMTWYAGAGQQWAQNPQTGVVINNPDSTKAIWPLLTSATPSPQSGRYTQSWKQASDPQFILNGTLKPNTATMSSSFTNLTFSRTTVSPGSTFDPQTGTLTLSESGTSTATFTGKFSSIVSSISGVSFNFQFNSVGAGDQLVISVDDLLGNQLVHYVMTGTVAGTSQQFGTLSLGSLATRFNATVQIQLVPASGSKGATVTLTNMNQFTTPS